ncbi:hypothetical protein T4B_7655 [Trichinella pseudospiralis]|uniref:Uncharacterized protein n=1 Tax=Trichinella pseudospiralis TaxID=6337 RepID=A0A0V1JJ65_TRIPS|nr:hypothetical protein T4B_7655 [Trichinella pseudospiralis]
MKCKLHLLYCSSDCVIIQFMKLKLLVDNVMKFLRDKVAKKIVKRDVQSLSVARGLLSTVAFSEHTDVSGYPD